MRRVLLHLVGAGLILAMAGCATAASPTGATPVTAAPKPSTTPPCPDMLAVVKAFLDANDAERYDESLTYLTPDVAYANWAEGVNGRHWQEKHLSGREALRPLLGQRGLRRVSGQAGKPVFHEGKPTILDGRVSFMLQPDRLSPSGRPYNPYQIQAEFDGCQIKSLTVIEFISWE
jgi:hypothetical protein